MERENDMTCKICGSGDTRIIYNGAIRNGGVGKYTSQNVPMYQCGCCGVIWHGPVVEDISRYYESKEYRASLDEASEEAFYRLHDRETLDKLQYTGTAVYRNKTVADIGCGAGAFLDFVQGAARDVIAIEPSEMFREALVRKGYHTYPYAQDAMAEWKEKVDVVTSFDVIEHVDAPQAFMDDAYALIVRGGALVLGTPTDAPVMRRVLGEAYEKQVLFSVQHQWIFSGESLGMLAERAGFKDIEVRYYQRYGIENLLGWCLEKRPNAGFKDRQLAGRLDAAFRSACSADGAGDYIILQAEK